MHCHDLVKEIQHSQTTIGGAGIKVKCLSVASRHRLLPRSEPPPGANHTSIPAPPLCSPSTPIACTSAPSNDVAPSAGAATSRARTVGKLEDAAQAQRQSPVARSRHTSLPCCSTMATTSFPARDTLVLFDIDGTLTVPMQKASHEMVESLKRLRHSAAIGVVGGSNLDKARAQLGADCTCAANE